MLLARSSPLFKALTASVGCIIAFSVPASAQTVPPLSAQTPNQSNESGFEFPSTVPGFEKLENVHYLGSPSILRGSDPGSQVSILKQQGITDVLIYRTETHGKAVDFEINELRKAGYPSSSIFHIPVEWKTVQPFRDTCLQTLEALRLLQVASTTKGRRMYVHCTAGQDRTGVLSALFLMLNGQGSKKDLFASEMCAKGFAGASKTKPDHIAKSVREVLTPQYLKMASLIESGKLTFTTIDDSLCEQDPASDAKFAANLKEDLKTYACD